MFVGVNLGVTGLSEHGDIPAKTPWEFTREGKTCVGKQSQQSPLGSLVLEAPPWLVQFWEQNEFPVPRASI